MTIFFLRSAAATASGVDGWIPLAVGKGREHPPQAARAKPLHFVLGARTATSLAESELAHHFLTPSFVKRRRRLPNSGKKVGGYFTVGAATEPCNRQEHSRQRPQANHEILSHKKAQKCAKKYRVFFVSFRASLWPLVFFATCEDFSGVAVHGAPINSAPALRSLE
jgi:hypothetical protein